MGINISNHPNIFRALFILLTLVLVEFAVVSIYTTASSPSDENYFRNIPSQVYVVKAFHAQLLKKSEQPDSILVGDLIVSVNNKTTRTKTEAQEKINAIASSDEVTLVVFRPSLNTNFTYSVLRAALAEEMLEDIPFSVHVFAVLPNGASDRAGMQTGDLIYRINKKTFSDALEADSILVKGQIGKSLEYDIIRNNTKTVLHVQLARFGISIGAIAMFIVGFFYMGTGTFLALKRPAIVAARFLGSAFLAIGFYIISVNALRRDYDLTTWLYVRNFFTAFSVSAGIVLWFHSSLYFPKEKISLLKHKKHYVALYGVSFFASVALAYFQLRNIIFLAVFMMLYGGILKFVFRKTIEPAEKKIMLLTKWTVVGVVAVLTLLNIAASYLKPDQNTVQIVVSVLIAMIPLSYLYTIGRYRLLDLSLRIRRNFQYTIITVVWIIILWKFFLDLFFAIPQFNIPIPNITYTGTSLEFSDAPASAAQLQFSQQIVLMGLAILAVFLFLKVKRIGQKFIDKKYYRTQYDYKRAAIELADVLGTKLGMDDLARGIVEKLADLMKLKRAGVIFFRNEKECCCEEVFGFDGTEWKNFCLTEHAVLVHTVQNLKSEMRVEYLPSGVKENFYANGFQFIVPIRSKNHMLGALLVGEKRAETSFHEEDISFLNSAATQASVAIENAFLYEELTEKERMKHELEIARKIQLASLPQTTPQIPGLEISGASLPAMEVGGDFFDYLETNEKKITIIIGDVSGKGTSAALYMSKVQGILRSLHGFALAPRALFERANKLLWKDLEKHSFITVLGAQFDMTQKTVHIARAGHLPLYYFNAETKSVEKLTPKGLGLGLNDTDIIFSQSDEKEIHFYSNDIFLFVTDGITEARTLTGKDFGDEQLFHIIEQSADESAAQLKEKIFFEVKKFIGDAQPHDDQTVVVVKIV